MHTTTKSLSSEIWKKFSTGYNIIGKQHMRKMVQHKLTTPQFNVLEVLFDSKVMSLKKISNELNVTGANITCVIDNLEKRELVVRIPSKEDRRIINAELTQKGQDVFQSIFPQYLDLLDETTTNLADNEKKEFIRLLDKLVA